MRRSLVVLAVLAALAGPAWAHADGDGEEAAATPPGGAYGMPYPLAKEPAVDDIYHVPTGLLLSFEGMMDLIAGSRLVYVGETHDNVHAHRVQLAVIRELQRRFPGQVAIGMEMFRLPQQEILDRWTRGELDERAFLKESRWGENWGGDFGYYREILAFARDNRIDVVALKPARDVELQVNRAGLDALPPELKAAVPEMAEPDAFQLGMLQGVFGGHTATSGALEGFLRTQVFWEETMAARIVEYLRGPRGGGKRMVVLCGGWHAVHGFGIPKKVLRRAPWPYAVVLPEEISIPEDKQDKVMQVDIPEIPLLRADFLWLVPYEDLETKRVRLGVQIEDTDGGVLVKGVLEGSPAEKAGIRAGSVILTFDGRPVWGGEGLVEMVQGKRPGDRATLVLREDGAERAVEVELFVLPKKKPPEAPAHPAPTPAATPEKKPQD